MVFDYKQTINDNIFEIITVQGNRIFQYFWNIMLLFSIKIYTGIIHVRYYNVI